MIGPVAKYNQCEAFTQMPFGKHVYHRDVMGKTCLLQWIVVSLGDCPLKV